MEFTLRGKSMEITPALRQYAEKKLRKIEKYLKQSPATCQVVFSTQRENHVIEVTVSANGFLLRAEETAKDPFSSVDSVVEKLERQLEKHRTRLLRRDKVGSPAEARRDQEGPVFVRVKRFALKPMTPEEAAMQMDLLGHDFFVFTNADTTLVSVVYRRKDGNYGLIEPEE